MDRQHSKGILNRREGASAECNTDGGACQPEITHMYLHVSEAGSKGSGTSANGEKAGSVSVF